MKGTPFILAFIAFFILISVALLMFSVKIALAVFAGGLVVVMIFFRPFWGLLIYLMLLYIRPQEFVGALRAQPIMLAMAVTVLGTLLVHNALMRKPFIVFDMRQGLYIAVFFALIPLSQLQRLYLTGARDAFDAFLPTFLMFFMIVNLVRDFSQMRKTFILLLYMTIFLALNGILQYWRGIDIAGQTMYQGRIRWIGIFEDPNDLGLTILAFTPFAVLSMIRRRQTIIKRGIWLLVTLVLVYALYLTNSRGTFIGLLAVLAWMLARRWGPVRGLSFAAVLAAVLFLAGPSRFAEISATEASASGRIDAWATGIGLLIWRPVLGVGFGSFTEYHHLTAHNSVVLCMAELGLAGLFVWLLMIVSSFEESLKIETAGRGTEYAFYGEVLQSSLIGFFTAAFFLSRTYNEVLFIIIALAALLSHFARQEFGFRAGWASRRTLIRTGLFMIGLVVLIRILVML